MNAEERKALQQEKWTLFDEMDNLDDQATDSARMRQLAISARLGEIEKVLAEDK